MNNWICVWIFKSAGLNIIVSNKIDMCINAQIQKLGMELFCDYKLYVNMCSGNWHRHVIVKICRLVNFEFSGKCISA